MTPSSTGVRAAFWVLSVTRYAIVSPCVPALKSYLLEPPVNAHGFHEPAPTRYSTITLVPVSPVSPFQVRLTKALSTPGWPQSSAVEVAVADLSRPSKAICWNTLSATTSRPSSVNAAALGLEDPLPNPSGRAISFWSQTCSTDLACVTRSTRPDSVSAMRVSPSGSRVAKFASCR